MKELTIEEKAKRYDDAIEKARRYYDEYKTRDNILYVEDMEDMFPELKESEDEKIKKEIIDYISKATGCKRWINWLEKHYDKLQDKSALEVINEEKVDNVNKIEPKFKVGDFITNDYCFGKVIAFIDGAYLLDTGQSIPFSCEHNAHLWTIEDAKDGDVLSFNDGHGNDCIELIKSITGKKIEFWFCLTNSNRYEVFDGNLPYTNLASRKDATPATKEQRDLLFQKMKEAGYEWDAGKKELKKIEQKPAWSKKDDRILDGIIEEIEANKSSATDYDIPVYDRFLSFLKSLKERYTWKPSDAQMKAIQESIGIVGELTPRGECLKELEEQLKKLKG